MRVNPYFILPDRKRVSLEVENYVPYLRHRRADAGTAAAATKQSARAKSMWPAAPPAPCTLIRNTQHLCPSPLSCAGGGNAPACPGEEVEASDAVDVFVKTVPTEDPTRDAADIELSLREKATTIEHLLTHLPKTPFSEACIRGTNDA